MANAPDLPGQLQHVLDNYGKLLASVEELANTIEKEKASPVRLAAGEIDFRTKPFRSLLTDLAYCGKLYLDSHT